MSVYHAQVQRDGKYWSVWVPEVERVTQARSLREVEPMVRDLVVVMDPDAVIDDVRVEIQMPAAAADHFEAAQHLLELTQQANAAAAAERAAAAQSLKQAGLTVRDIGETLGVSFQRAHQLLQQHNEEFLTSRARAWLLASEALRAAGDLVRRSERPVDFDQHLALLIEVATAESGSGFGTSSVVADAGATDRPLVTSDR
ncbi:hypothetical protein [Nakamurella leprariae]|uniref:Uncharacterized protein n=1 Tax=Nakamurella leprariae TaxID=2803911 RepID=A0A938YGK3_9ACTN|nr:hypothetical protein [Nakamurella leprariae]MBM9469504.1 hypothetical protein [Nakamurella leprariae]